MNLGTDDQLRRPTTSSPRSRRTATGCSSRAPAPGRVRRRRPLSVLPRRHPQRLRLADADEPRRRTSNTAVERERDRRLLRERRPPAALLRQRSAGGPAAATSTCSNLQADGTWGRPRSVPELSSTGVTTIGRTSARTGWRSSSTRLDPGGSAASDLWTATRATVDATLVDAGQPRRDREQQRQRPAPLRWRRTGGRSSSTPTRAGGSGGFDLYVTTRAASSP